MRRFTEKYEQLGKTIRYYREKRKLSKQELAMKIREKESLLDFIENSAANQNGSLGKLAMRVLFKIADALEIDIAALFEVGTEEKFQQYRWDKDKQY